jgi:catechol 1,2-dioxygenase
MKKINRRFFLKSLFNLGLFSLIPFKLKALNFLEENCETSTDIEGPFYIENPPNISILTPPNITSNFLFITGTVYAKDCKTPIPNALVDIWHANKGTYDTKSDTYLNSDYENDFYRGKVFTDENGNYAFQTILPGKYLNGIVYRPSHIHYKSSYLNENEITTQLYFEGDTSIETDPWASDPIAVNRIVQLEEDEEENLHAIFDIFLNVNPEDIENTGIQEEKIIKSIYPNPINSNTVIHLNSKTSTIDICDINGRIISRKENIQNTIKMTDILKNKIPAGIYVLRVLQQNRAIDSKRFIITN